MFADDADQDEADGYTVVKVMAGFEPIEATIAKFEAIRQAVGSNLDITVDANQAWEVIDASPTSDGWSLSTRNPSNSPWQRRT